MAVHPAAWLEKRPPGGQEQHDGGEDEGHAADDGAGEAASARDASFMTNGSISRCGSGSQTVPICSGPGVRESRMRRAMFRCASASP